MKVLITGGSGMLGSVLNKTLSKNYDILTIYNSNKKNCNLYNSNKVDISDFEKVNLLFSEFNPDIVVHTAAISNPTLADKTSPKEVNRINVKATENIAKLCDLSNAKLIYTSTDLVYAGYRGTLLKEDAKLVPISLYAESKLMGEVKIQETFDNYIILRTALMIGLGQSYSRNHFNQIYENLKQKKEVPLFVDQFRSPFAFNEAANVIEQLIAKNIRGEIINFGGENKLSRYQLGELLCDELKLDKNLLKQVKMSEKEFKYKVEDVSLNVDKLASYGVKQKSISESINEMVGNNEPIR